MSKHGNAERNLTSGGRKSNGQFDFDDEQGTCGIGPDQLGAHMPFNAFVRLVDALIDHPTARPIAAGRDGATSASSDIFWTYTPRAGLHVETRTGYLATATGDGGFSLDVETDGSWRLAFHGSDKVLRYDADGNNLPAPVPPPPADNEYVLLGPGASSYNAARGHVTVDGGLGWETIQGGVGDYMIGGSGTLGGGQAGRGNCALYSASPDSVLVDMEHGRGYGGNAEGNVLVNINQVRGSLFSNVLIGAHTGSDLKSGGDNSLLISTGGDGFEMRPDGSGNVLVSTAGDDWVVFDPTKGWSLGDQNVMLGFDGSAGGDFLDLRMLTSATGVLGSNFHTTSAVGYDATAGHGDIAAYVRVIDAADGSHVMFSANGSVDTAGTEIMSLKFVHGLDARTMFDQGAIRA